jgi:hypothetical protein
VLDGTSSPSLATPTYPVECGPGLCLDYKPDLSSSILYPTGFFSYDSASQGIQVSFSDVTFDDGTIYTVAMRGILPPTLRTACVYYFKAFSILFKYISITAPAAAQMTAISYNLGAATTSYSFPAFTVSRPAETAARFNLYYSVVTTSGVAVGAPISSFVVAVISSSRVIQI